MMANTIIINGKQVTKEEYQTYCKQKNLEEVQRLLNQYSNNKWIEFDGYIFEDKALAKEFATDNYNFEEEDFEPITIKDILDLSYIKVEYIYTWDKWEEEKQLCDCEEEFYHADLANEETVYNRIIRESLGF